MHIGVKSILQCEDVITFQGCNIVRKADKFSSRECMWVFIMLMRFTLGKCCSFWWKFFIIKTFFWKPENECRSNLFTISSHVQRFFFLENAKAFFFKHVISFDELMFYFKSMLFMIRIVIFLESCIFPK